MSRRPPFTVAQLAAFGLILLSIKAAPVIAICPDAPTLSNVDWYLTDSLAGCPAGDSLISAYMPSGIPSRMRVFLIYHDDTCAVKVGVPPESIWVTVTPIEGNVRANDKTTTGLTYADDSTNGQGEARVTVPSFSGCGKVRVRLYVSHSYQGFIDVRVRTIDYNASGDVTSDEGVISVPCDVNYDGSANGLDNIIGLAPHQQGKHSHRFALHGTMVRRTNLVEGGGVPRLGASVDFWSPNNRWISFTVTTSQGCRVFLTASDPKDGNYLRQFTFNPPDSVVRDYDPSWSPLGDLIVFDRDDWRVMKKGIPGVAGVTDTSLYTLTVSGEPTRGDYTPCVSPNGQWVAFARRDVADTTFPAHIWKIPIGGGTAKQLTSGSDRIDNYPRWSPDGEWIFFDRQTKADATNNVWKVRQDSTSLQLVYNDPRPNFNTATPAPSPDGKIFTAAVGTRSDFVQDTRTHTFDVALAASSHRPVVNYPDPEFSVAAEDPLLAPVLSPDGTRLRIGARQVWVTRRNMSLPPKLTQVGVQALHDTTARLFIEVIQGLPSTTTITATDPEADTLTYRAFFLPTGMTFDAATRTLSWNPSAPVGSKHFVKLDVTTRSGGTDAVIAVFTVVSAFTRSSGGAAAVIDEQGAGPNPMRERFAVPTRWAPGQRVALTLFDPLGRRVAVVAGKAGETLVWDGRDFDGRRARPGVYLYRLQRGAQSETGRVVVLE